MKKQTKQSRKTKARKDRQARERQRAHSAFENWLRTPEGFRARQLRTAALVDAVRRVFR